MDIEAGIQYTQQDEKVGIQEEIQWLLDPTKGMTTRIIVSSNQYKIIKELKKKYFQQTRKTQWSSWTNKRTTAYHSRKKLEEGKFCIISKDPLPDFIKRVEETLADCKP